MVLSNEKKYKYQLVYEWIRACINDGTFTAGNKLYSENVIAEQFKISRLTVRKAIENLESEGLIYKIRGSGTYVNNISKIVTNNTKKIGVITTVLRDYLFTSIIYGIDSVISEHGYTMSLGMTNNLFQDERRVIKSIVESGVDGLIIETTKSALPNPNIDLYHKIDELGIPYVFIHGYYKELDPVYVVTEDSNCGAKAVEYLYSLGHKNIACIFKSDDMQGVERFSGFVRALISLGLEVIDNRLIWFATDGEEEVFTGENEKLVLEKIKGCTAVVCYSDLLAMLLIKYLNCHGVKVPEDISVIGFDNWSVSHLSLINVTTFDHPKEKLGQEAAKRLLQMINTGKKAESITMEMKMIIKDSTSKI